jgi:hypothetical protein
MEETTGTPDYPVTDEDFRKFRESLRDEDQEELDRIITRYISYEPAMAEAALYVDVDRGIISYDVKEQVLSQVRFNFSKKAKAAKQLNWERNNAFSGYVSGYTDDKLLNLVEDPSDIVIDVYHAVLLEMVKRDLISQAEYDRLYSEALKSSRSDEEIRKEEEEEFFSDFENDESLIDDKMIEEQKENFWKCPGCGELVDINYGICWNCQTPIPEKTEPPSSEEIKKELSSEKKFKPIRTGLALIAVAGLVILRDYFRYSHRDRFPDAVALGFAAFFLLPGIALIVYGIFKKLSDK